MKVTYVGASTDSSGYAEAARNNIAALHSVGVEVAVQRISFETKKTNLGQLGQLIEQLSKNRPDSPICILHATPPNYPRLIQKDKYNIGYAAWETSRLPEKWVSFINALDEVWVPSQHNVEVFKESGIKIPVVCIPHTFNSNAQPESTAVLENCSEDDFIFYSIFQWLERKNPAGLIRAYLTEFKSKEKVVLVLKTFAVAAGNHQEAEQIRKKIQFIKSTLYLKSYPRILLITSLLSKNQVASIHSEGDCYISLSRCEGFGIPIAEAMIAGNPVISTGYGGPVDFITSEKTGYLVDYMPTPVANMPWEMYEGYGVWAEPNLMQTRQYMRTLFENQKQAERMGKRGKEWITKNLSWETIGSKMKNRLEKIRENL